MRRTTSEVVSGLLVLAGVLVGGGSALAAGTADPAATLETFCQTCHSERMGMAGLVLEGLDPTAVGDHPEIWEKVVQKLRTRAMPPAGRPRPDDATYEALADGLESSLDRVAAERPDPGRPLLHRLNRTEYRNAVRDLLDLEIDTSSLPADDSAFGFDNVADSLGTSPLLLESYVTSARKVSRLAVGRSGPPPAAKTFRAPEDLTQDYHLRRLPLGSRGGLIVDEYLPVDGEYELRVRMRRQTTGQIRGIGEEHQVELAVDGERVGLFAVGGPDVYKPTIANKQNPTQTLSPSFTADEHMHVRLPLAAGPHTITATFVGRPGALPEGTTQPYLRSYVGGGDLPDIEHVQLTGPFEARRTAGDTPSRSRIFSCRPDRPEEELPCASAILGRLGRLAFRRPLAPHELDRILAFYHDGRANGDFESGIELALRFVLASPQFIFRFEAEPAGTAAGEAFRISDLDLASRLSFFLWSSLPDDELLTLAEAGRLREPGELPAQLMRMLADPRAHALVDNFAGQWLYLRNLDGARPDPLEFPDWDDNLRQSLRAETELFFASILREDRSVLDLLDADYTFVNERLARHYGVDGIYGDHMRRVEVADPNRRGLLGHGSILTVTSYANRTSPVLRGKWILDNLLGAAPPPPPPDVPDLEEAPESGPLSMRERLTQHRASPACAGCHARMDPLGFGLENFDAVGRWRTRDVDGSVIDAADTLADGQSFDGPAELRDALLARPDVFLTNFTRKLLTYALGRGVDHADMPAIRAILRRVEDDDYRFQAMVAAIVASDPFQMKLAGATDPAPETGG